MWTGGGILCQCPAQAGHRMKIFISAVVEPTNISRASVKQILAWVLRTGLFWRAVMKTGAQWSQWWSECLGQLEIVCPMSVLNSQCKCHVAGKMVITFQNWQLFWCTLCAMDVHYTFVLMAWSLSSVNNLLHWHGIQYTPGALRARSSFTDLRKWTVFFVSVFDVKSCQKPADPVLFLFLPLWKCLQFRVERPVNVHV